MPIVKCTVSLQTGKVPGSFRLSSVTASATDEHSMMHSIIDTMRTKFFIILPPVLFLTFLLYPPEKLSIIHLNLTRFVAFITAAEGSSLLKWTQCTIFFMKTMHFFRFVYTCISMTAFLRRVIDFNERDLYNVCKLAIWHIKRCRHMIGGSHYELLARAYVV